MLTLTCVSTGGPATTVLWTTKDSGIITQGVQSVLDGLGNITIFTLAYSAFHIATNTYIMALTSRYDAFSSYELTDITWRDDQGAEVKPVLWIDDVMVNQMGKIEVKDHASCEDIIFNTEKHTRMQ